MDEIARILKSTGMPFAYDHFAEGEFPKPPFLCYSLSGSENFSADGKVYQKITRAVIELYTNHKDLKSEMKVESALDNAGIFYDTTEVWLPSEKLYEVRFSFSMRR